MQQISCSRNGEYPKSVVAQPTSLQIAMQVRDIAEARRFYQEVLGCVEGRGGEQWLDFGLYGHQFVCRLDPQMGRHGRVTLHYDPVVGKFAPASYRSVVLEAQEWSALAERLMRHKVAFEPVVYCKGVAGEQATLRLLDPSGNALEFKSSRIIAEQFLRREQTKSLTKYAPWAILAVSMWVWLLLHAGESANGIPSPLPPCASKAFCMP